MFRNLARLDYKDSKIVIFVYDIANKESFKELNTWKKDIEDRIGPDFIKGIIANKSDLFLKESVREEEVEEYAKSINAKFLYFSAKNESPKKLENFISELLEEYIQLKEKDKNQIGINLNEKNETKKKKSDICSK